MQFLTATVALVVSEHQPHTTVLPGLEGCAAPFLAAVEAVRRDGWVQPNGTETLLCFLAAQVRNLEGD